MKDKLFEFLGALFVICTAAVAGCLAILALILVWIIPIMIFGASVIGLWKLIAFLLAL